VASGLGDDIFGDTERIEQGDSGNDEVDKDGSQRTDHGVCGNPRIIRLVEWTADGEPGQQSRTNE
jgi:hypothetical protein